MEPSQWFVGIDWSTQTLKATVIDENLIEFHDWELQINYDKEFGQQYGLKGGVLRESDLTVTTPSIVWIKALELLLEKWHQKGFPFHKVRAISGSGQQHGSVYWKTGALQKLKLLDPTKSLSVQMISNEIFSVQNSPIWMDSSTSTQCHQLESLYKNETDPDSGKLAVSQLTGSIPYERFTINQIAKIISNHPEQYLDTECISLVSSFVSSLLVGSYVNIDYSDASGMNAMDIRTKQWILKIVDWCESLLPTPNGTNHSLQAKLGQPCASNNVAGKIHSYYVERYRFSPDCIIGISSGDNPCSFAGLGLQEGDVSVSLGTSSTLFGAIKDPQCGLEGHIFCNPIDNNSYMALLCFKNGSLTREYIRDTYCAGSWEQFNSKLKHTPVGNHGNLAFYFLDAEITPKTLPGTYRFDSENNFVEEFNDKESNVRAVIEWQFLSMYVHAQKIGLGNFSKIVATGGASQNTDILAILSNVFGVPVFVQTQPNSASLGAAYKALHTFRCMEKNRDVAFSEILSNSAARITKVAEPNMEHHSIYNNMAQRFNSLEKHVLQIQKEEMK